MTNTINNVPRELYTCIGKGGEYEYLGLSAGAGMARGEQRQVYRCTVTGLIFHRECMDFKQRMERLSAPSPAGVDGLEVVATVEVGDEDRESGVCDGLDIIPGDVPFFDGEELCRLSDAQAIIDGLRGEVERLQMQLAACGVVALANTIESAGDARQMHPDYMSASCSDVADAVDREITLRTERDRQAQRIGELEGLLREFAVGISKREMPTEQELNSWFDRIDAALSAGKEGE